MTANAGVGCACAKVLASTIIHLSTRQSDSAARLWEPVLTLREELPFLRSLVAVPVRSGVCYSRMSIVTAPPNVIVAANTHIAAAKS